MAKKRLMMRVGWRNKMAPILPRRKRQLLLLKRAARRYSDAIDSTEIGILVHAEGGIALKGDAKELIEEGLLTMRRVAYSRGWGGDYWLRRTRLFLTEKGRAALERGRI